MSNLINAIKAVKTGKVSPLRTMQFSDSWTPSHAVGVASEYEFTAKVSVKLDLQDPETYPSANREILKTVRHMVAEEVFGEFRGRLLELRARAYSSGDQTSGVIVDSILDGMFKV